MKKFIYLLAGGFFALLIGVVVSIPLNQWITTQFIKSEDDVSSHFSIFFLFICPLFIFVGIFAGRYFYYRRLSKTKTTHAENNATSRR